MSPSWKGVWTCPICGKEFTSGEASFYSQGNYAEIEILQGEIEKLEDILTHIVTEHIMKPSNTR